MRKLGEIIGKTSTNFFKFKCDVEVKKFEYVTVTHNNNQILSQITELERNSEQLTAFCQVIGYKDENNKFQKVKVPFLISASVYLATDDYIKQIIKLQDQDNGAYVGKLEGKDIDVFLDINRLISKHLSVLAKSGSGKSYCVGVILEEIIQRGIPLLIIDPHGEYNTLKSPNDDKRGLDNLKRF